MDFLIEDWNRWVIERYGSVEHAVADWGLDPGRTAAGKLPIPPVHMFREAGEWHRLSAAFRRGFSDLIGAKYRDLAAALRDWDPKHLISFRGGGCGVPSGHRFAHAHSVGAAKHMDFLNPEGYNLHTAGWEAPTPADDIRRGGLVTLYYRFISREKPVVWMEFGYTVNGFHRKWKPGLVHIDPKQLHNQRSQLDHFYAMALESGARGAAPWWFPGGFRLAECSDFGIVDPDGAPRPAVEVLRTRHPAFEQVVHREPTRVLQIDFDARCVDGWELYSQQYLDAVKAGDVPYLRTAGTGTDSATCPLTAVGGNEYSGNNPPQFLNAEFNRLELKFGDGPWRPIRGDETLRIKPGASVRCRASVGNLGEAMWLAPGVGQPERGRVFLAGREEFGFEFRAPIAAGTAFLADADVDEFLLAPSVQKQTILSFEMSSRDRACFGERRTVTLVPAAEAQDR
jgi:hypothetical protein